MKAVYLSIFVVLISISLVVSFSIYLDEAPDKHNDTEINAVIATYDKNDDGLISLQEFIEIYTADGSITVERATQVFTDLDTNGDGLITTDELASIFAQNYATNIVGHDFWNFSWFTLGVAGIAFMTGVLWVIQDFNSSEEASASFFGFFSLYLIASVGALAALMIEPENLGYDSGDSYWAAFGMICMNILLLIVSVASYKYDPSDRAAKIEKQNEIIRKAIADKDRILGGARLTKKEKAILAGL